VKKRLESVIRTDEAADDLVLLLRGGVHAREVERLQSQAADLDRLYTWRGGPCFGVSVFAATPDTEGDVLATRMDVRRSYYRINYSDIAGRLVVVPTFRAPHWTVMFDGPRGAQYQLLVDCYGQLRENPYWTRKPGRRPPR
jgi:hypothetical protein